MPFFGSVPNWCQFFIWWQSIATTAPHPIPILFLTHTFEFHNHHNFRLGHNFLFWNSSKGVPLHRLGFEDNNAFFWKRTKLTPFRVSWWAFTAHQVYVLHEFSAILGKVLSLRLPKERKTLSENCTIKWKLDCHGHHALSFLERLGLLYSALFYDFSIVWFREKKRSRLGKLIFR